MFEAENDQVEAFWAVLGDEEFAKADYWQWRRMRPMSTLAFGGLMPQSILPYVMLPHSQLATDVAVRSLRWRLREKFTPERVAQSVQAGVNSEHTTRRTFNTEQPGILNCHSVHQLSCLEPVVFRRIRPRTHSVISGDFPHSQNWESKMTFYAEAAMTILWTAQDRLTKKSDHEKCLKLRHRQILDAEAYYVSLPDSVHHLHFEHRSSSHLWLPDRLNLLLRNNKNKSINHLSLTGNQDPDASSRWKCLLFLIHIRILTRAWVSRPILIRKWWMVYDVLLAICYWTHTRQGAILPFAMCAQGLPAWGL